MAANNGENTVGSPQEHIPTCSKHNVRIDMLCEDCDEFICSKCAKTDHSNHNWDTLATVVSERKIGLHTYLNEIMKDDLPEIDNKIQKIKTQMEENKSRCDKDVQFLQRHHEEIVSKLEEIKKRHEQKLRVNLAVKDEQMNRVKSQLEKKKKQLTDLVKFMEENNCTMSDYNFFENYRELTQLLSDLDVDFRKCEEGVRFGRGKIIDKLLRPMFGKTFDLDEIIATEMESFQFGDNAILMLESFSDDNSYIKSFRSDYTKQTNKKGEKKKEFKVKPNDLCVSRSSVYFTNTESRSINRLKPTGSVSIVLRTDPLLPGGICSQKNGGLLVTLYDDTSQWNNLNSESRRLVRHISSSGDTIRDYEHTADSQTKLFTMPVKVTQNGNFDICIVNWTSRTKGNLVILSSSGHLRSIYRGQASIWNFLPFDVVCDSLFNILVSDRYNDRIHLLSPDGDFMKYLLTENEVNFPISLSLWKSNLWVGNEKGLVKVFKYENSVK